MELQRRLPARHVPTWRKVALSGLGAVTEAEFWEQADPVKGHAMAVAAGVKWVIGRGWIPQEAGDMESPNDADLGSWQQASRFTEQAEQFVRDARAAARDMKWDPVRGIWVSLRTGQPCTARGGTSDMCLGGPAAPSSPTPSTGAAPSSGGAVTHTAQFPQLPGGSVSIGGTDVPWLLIGGGLIAAYFLFMRGQQ